MSEVPPRASVVARGVAVFHVRVGADGTALDIALAKSSGHEELDASALEAVRKWRFHPRLEHGQAVEATIEVPVTFSVR